MPDNIVYLEEALDFLERAESAIGRCSDELERIHCESFDDELFDVYQNIGEVMEALYDIILCANKEVA